MLFTPKRLLKLIPILLVIIFVIALTTYRTRVVSSLRNWAEEKSEESAAGRFLSSVFVRTLLDNGTASAEDDGESENIETVRIETGASSYDINVEVADTEEKRMQGLMGRDDLCSDCGMLFIHETDSTGGFWMKNCVIPLDIIFIDKEGLIVDIKENFEPCPAYPCPSYTPDHSYRYALEMNGGWVDAHNVGIGDEVSFPEIGP